MEFIDFHRVRDMPSDFSLRFLLDIFLAIKSVNGQDFRNLFNSFHIFVDLLGLPGSTRFIVFGY